MAEVKKRILSKATRITLNPWTEGVDGTFTAPASAETAIQLNEIVADSTTITREDPTTESIDCETSDTPITEVTTLGKVTVEMTSANIGDEILTKCLGFEKLGESLVAAPAAHKCQYATLEVEFQGSKIVVPKLHLDSKIDASSFRSNVVKGTISGTALDAYVKAKTVEKKTPLFIAALTDVLGTAYTFSETATAES